MKMTANKKRWVVMMLLLIGLRTLVTIPHRNGEVYLSSHGDIVAIRQLMHPVNPFWTYGPMIKIPWVTLCACDIPIALVADTLLLPYDYFVGKQKGFFILVVDDHGHPVPKAVLNGYSRSKVNGTTDGQGLYRWASDSKDIEWFEVSKSGYYKTAQHPGGWGHGGLAGQLNDANTNTLNVVLKRIVEPIPMYAKEAKVRFPTNEGAFGYDLMAGDLVVPFGKGSTADFVFRLSHDPKAASPRKEYGLLLDITFSNEGDGIQPFFVPVKNDEARSELASDHAAPLTGYQPSLKEANAGSNERYEQPQPKYAYSEGRWHRHKEGRWADEINYYFRVRSKSDGSALYGKVYGFYRLQNFYDGTQSVEFIYYLNPDGSGNVEFAPGKSLLESSPRGATEYVPALP